MAKQRTKKPSWLFFAALFPLVIFGLYLGDSLSRNYLRPEFYVGRQDNPTASSELMIAFLFSWTYIPVINRLAKMKQKDYTRKINFIRILRGIEMVLWVPISIGILIISVQLFFIIINPRPVDFKASGIYYIPILAALIPLGLRLWRKNLIKRKSSQKLQD